MSIVDTISKIADWLNSGPCLKIKFKVPAPEGKAMDESYEYSLVHPTAFPLYVPARGRLPPAVKTEMPSIAVMIEDGEDRLVKDRYINIVLAFSCWNPGNHEKDIFYSGSDEKFEAWKEEYFPTIEDRQTKESKLVKYRKTADGWMDLWNFIDTIIREIEQIDLINEIEIVKNVPVKFEPFKEQDSVPDYYPFWFGTVRFTVHENIIRNNDIYRELL